MLYRLFGSVDDTKTNQYPRNVAALIAVVSSISAVKRFVDEGIANQYKLKKMLQ
jgi:hypothetical protein